MMGGRCTCPGGSDFVEHCTAERGGTSSALDVRACVRACVQVYLRWDELDELSGDPSVAEW